VLDVRTARVLDVGTIRLDELTIRTDELAKSVHASPLAARVPRQKSKKAVGNVDRRTAGST